MARVGAAIVLSARVRQLLSRFKASFVDCVLWPCGLWDRAVSCAAPCAPSCARVLTLRCAASKVGGCAGFEVGPQDFPVPQKPDDRGRCAASSLVGCAASVLRGYAGGSAGWYAQVCAASSGPARHRRARRDQTDTPARSQRSTRQRHGSCGGGVPPRLPKRARSRQRVQPEHGQQAFGDARRE
jgi:hypothetical protein